MCLSSLLRAVALGVSLAMVAAGQRLDGQAANQRGASIGRTGASQASAPGELTLDAVYQRLQRANPQVAAARAAATASAARVAAAGTLPDPRVQLGFMGRDLPSLQPMETLGMDQVQVMQMVPLAGKLGLASDAARARAQAAGTRVSAMLWSVRRDAALAFYDMWAAGRQLVVARETRDLLRQAADAAESMYRVGQGRQADVLRAQMEITRMTEEIVRLGAMRRSMAARLAGVLDAPGLADSMVPRIPKLDDARLPAAAGAANDSLADLAVAGRPGLAAGRQDVAAAEIARQLAERELWPDLEFGVQVARRPASAAPPSASGGAMSAGWMGSFMIGASIPIFAGRRQLRMRDEAAAMRDMAAADVRALEAETRGMVGEVTAELLRSRESRTLYASALLPQALATRDAAAAAYRTGGVDFMTLLDTHMTVNRIRMELYMLRASEGKAIAELETLLGRPLIDAAIISPLEEEVR